MLREYIQKKIAACELTKSLATSRAATLAHEPTEISSFCSTDARKNLEMELMQVEGTIMCMPVTPTHIQNEADHDQIVSEPHDQMYEII